MFSCGTRRVPEAGLTLIEVMAALGIVALASTMLYSACVLSKYMIANNRQRIEAETLAMDHIMEVFNTFDFSSVITATNLTAVAPPASGLLSENTEIRTMIIPNTDTVHPYKWDIEVRVRRELLRPGVRRVVESDDVFYRVTRYDTERN